MRRYRMLCPRLGLVVWFVLGWSYAGTRAVAREKQCPRWRKWSLVVGARRLVVDVIIVRTVMRTRGPRRAAAILVGAGLPE